MADAVHVAFDLGAESGRAVVGRFDGRTLVAETVRRFPSRAVRLPDGLYWDVLGHFAEIGASLGHLHRTGERVTSMGIDSWGVDFGLIDVGGALLANPRHHRDASNEEAVARALSRVSREELYETTGIQFLPFNTLYQLSALEHSSSLARADKMLLLPDLLNYWLTGEARAEATNASTTELLDARTGDWALPLFERLGIPAHIFPAIVEAGTVLGPLLPHVAEGTGLPATTPVVAVASHDTASAVVAVPARASGSSAYISSGTWSLVGIELDEPVLTAEARDANLTNERGFAGSIRLLKNVMGLWLVQECRRTWAAEGPALDYADIAALAQRAPADGPLFDPDRPELLTSGDMPRRIRAACISAGQRPPEGDAEMLRSIFESLACKYRMVIEQIEAVTARNVDTIHVIGGGARNAFLCQLTANISRRHVLARPVEAAAMGSLLVQLHAFGELGSLEDMREVVRQSTELMAYEPDPDAGAWGALYERFMDVVHVQSEKEAAAL